MYEEEWKGFRAFYELLFGTPIAYLFLLLVWKKLFRADHAGWKYALITLIGSSFFILNHYFFHAPFYSLLARSYAVIFLLFYYILLIRPQAFSLLRQCVAVLSAVIFTGVYIGAEEVARALADGRMLNGTKVPEFLFVLTAFLAFVIIILLQRKPASRM
ncbi:MAG TPA: hypothetical protein QF499_04375 [Gammaproteobacteria bacterium]|jgi:hypothetical protein|nr:hypothetical protein [Chromatiales bacterium]MCP4926250.1 hypothetical protein [Gammaproteobacteria bacterium]MDP7153059.1 hypothetical protein [Gammaproteobacteria bacterium]MDP7296867.1 hypothetical protein [Gammaproteobacteria bacterium]MDP7660167.1 hypothetical protein [Gammaproteobacteria bacterium]